MKKSTIVLMSIVFLGIISGFIFYILLFDDEELIYVESFDRSFVFELIEANVDEINISIDDHFNQTVFWLNNKEEFLNTVLLSSENYYEAFSKKTTVTDGKINLYTFELNNQCFYLKNNVDGSFSLTPCISEVWNSEVDLIFQFIPDQFLTNDSYYLYSDMNISGFDSFIDYKQFYEVFNNEYVEIDDLNESISLKGYNYDNMSIDEYYFVLLQFDDMGFSVSIERWDI